MNNTELPETRRFPIEPVSKAQEISAERWIMKNIKPMVSPRQRTWKTGIIYKLPEESAND